MSLTFVSEQLLTANKLSHQDLQSVLGTLSERRIDYADLYFQSSYHESWVLEDRIIKDGSYHIDQGVGIRAINGEKTGFAYATRLRSMRCSKARRPRAALCANRATARSKRWAKCRIAACTRRPIRWIA